MWNAELDESQAGIKIARRYINNLRYSDGTTLMNDALPIFFSSSSFSAIKVVSVYLSLLIFLPAILIPACDSSSSTFHIMDSAYKLNKHDDSTQPGCTPFPIFEPICFSVSGSNYYFLTCIQVSQKTCKMVWYSSLFKNFPVCCDPHIQSL